MVLALLTFNNQRHELGESRGRTALVWNVPDRIVGDVEVYSMVRGESANTLFQLAICVSGEQGEENAYCVDVRLGDGQFRINRYQNGRFSTLRSTRFSGDPAAWHHVRFRREGNRLLARTWPDGDPEPTRWSVTTTDETHRSGFVGLAGLQPGSSNDWAFLSVGVGGKTAPSWSEAFGSHSGERFPATL